MLPYQIQYIENIREIISLSDYYSISVSDYPRWLSARQSADARIGLLKEENIRLLEEHLFPTLDDLHNAGSDVIQDLDEFADQLLDWKANLDCGIYILIHDSLLSLFRVRRDRNRIIRELYKLGMGLYYQNRSVQGVAEEKSSRFHFENEMVFTEAGSYLKFYEQIDDEETRGFIIRSLANIAIAATDMKRRVAVSSRVLQIVQDPYYRDLAPSLPWDAFLLKTNQQMSANRHVMSKGDLSPQELSAVLEACSVVFEPEKNTSTPNVRWLWPYYEMEYSCGFVDLQTTLNRMEWLIGEASFDQYDVSGLYANVQLPVYYGRLMRDNPSLQTKARHVRFLDFAYRKMLRTMLTFPAARIDDFFIYNVILVITDYQEFEGVPSYLSLTGQLMKRLAGRLYIQSRQTGEVLRLFCRYIFESDPSFFDDIPFLGAISDPETKKEALSEYALRCGLYHDFGLIKMSLDRLCRSRNLFESEFQIYKLHTTAGADDLRARRSTEDLADIALGHHSWYDGSDGYPEEYVRTASPYRQMTDVSAIAVYLTEQFRILPEGGSNFMQLADEVLSLARKRFSPMAASCLTDSAFCKELEQLLMEQGEAGYREVYQSLSDIQSDPTLQAAIPSS